MTKAEREALEALADKWATDRNWGGDCVEELRALLATIDKPATRYPWADARPEEMFASTDRDGTIAFHVSRPVPKLDKSVGGYWLSGKMGSNEARYINRFQINASCPKWRESLERRPDAP